MANERIVVAVARDDVKRGARIRRCEPADVIRDVHVEGVRPAPFDVNVLASIAQRLQRGGESDGNGRLLLADEHHHVEVALAQTPELLGLHVFEIDEDVGGFHEEAPCGCDYVQTLSRLTVVWPRLSTMA